MDLLLDLLTTLGINQTIFAQFIVFTIAYIILAKFVFHPYYQAYMERYNRTTGSENDAANIGLETEDLKLEFEENAKALNLRIKNIYDDEKKNALKEQNKAFEEARKKVEEYKKVGELKVSEARDKIKNEISGEVDSVAVLIREKMISGGKI